MKAVVLHVCLCCQVLVYSQISELYLNTALVCAGSLVGPELFRIGDISACRIMALREAAFKGLPSCMYALERGLAAGSHSQARYCHAMPVCVFTSPVATIAGYSY